MVVVMQTSRVASLLLGTHHLCVEVFRRGRGDTQF